MLAASQAHGLTPTTHNNTALRASQGPAEGCSTGLISSCLPAPSWMEQFEHIKQAAAARPAPGGSITPPQGTKHGCMASKGLSASDAMLSSLAGCMAEASNSWQLGGPCRCSLQAQGWSLCALKRGDDAEKTALLVISRAQFGDMAAAAAQAVTQRTSLNAMHSCMNISEGQVHPSQQQMA